MGLIGTEFVIAEESSGFSAYLDSKTVVIGKQGAAYLVWGARKIKTQIQTGKGRYLRTFPLAVLYIGIFIQKTNFV